MVEEAGRRSPPGVRVATLDFERQGPPQPAGLVVSSLALQWAGDLRLVLERFWDGAGALAFTTLLEGSFAQWHSRCSGHDVEPGTIPLLRDVSLAQAVDLDGGAGRTEVREYLVRYAAPIDFVRSLRAIGANTPRSDYTPQPRLVRMLRTDHTPLDVTYRVAFCIIERN
jgi:malonyl-CoA O-methyltransferase